MSDVAIKIEPNSRQIPSSIIYTADKSYHDWLYSYLQEISYKEENDGDITRYVNKKDIVFSEIADRLSKDDKKISRQLVSRKFKGLVSMGLLEEEPGKKRYKLIKLERRLAMLVPFETLRCINNTLNRWTISVYVYLLNRYFAAGKKTFMFTNHQIKHFIGLSDSGDHDVKVNDILRVLGALGLVEIKEEFRPNEQGNYIICKYVVKVNNKIKE